MSDKYDVHKVNIDAPDEQKPKFLNEEQMHYRYSPEAAMDHYKKVVYYNQRKGGNGWYHGRVSNSYKNNFSKINWRD